MSYEEEADSSGAEDELAAMKEFEGRELVLALETAKQAHELCIAAGVPDAVLAAAGELVELLEAWAKETGVR